MLSSERKKELKEMSRMKFRHHRERRSRHILSAPFIYGMVIPLVILDVFLEAYHRVCFPLYGIPRLDRSHYIRIDRHKLAYLRGFEKVNCTYCGYANGLLRYATIIAAETERYWCGIKHSPTKNFVEPKHHRDFLPYGDEDALVKFISREDFFQEEGDSITITEKG